MASTQSTPTPTATKLEQPEAFLNDDASNARRKPSQLAKRTTTAERRATHNAVERARRETLNGRFLYLASLLPNLSQIRRPSKSAIVNSSIAHVNASRRHRLMASRVTQELLRETEEMRRELNEWRERAGVRKLEPRMRTEGLGMVLRGELEPISVSPGEDEDDEDFVYHQEMNMAAAHNAHHAPLVASYAQPVARPPVAHRHSYAAPMTAPMIVSPTAPVHYDPAHPANPHGMGYAPSHQQVVSAPHTALPSPPSAPAVHSPHASHHTPTPFAHSADPMYISQDSEKAYSMGYAAAHALQQGANIHTPWSDDSSSASSNSMEHPRSASGPGFHSPPSSPSSFEPSSGSRGSFDFTSYENYDSAYELVPPSSSGSSDGFLGGVPRGLTGQTMLSSPVGTPSDHFGMMGVV